MIIAPGRWSESLTANGEMFASKRVPGAVNRIDRVGCGFFERSGNGELTPRGIGRALDGSQA